MRKAKVGEPLPELVVRVHSRKAFETTESAKKIIDRLLSQPLFTPDRFESQGRFKPLISQNMEQVIEAVANLAAQRLDPERVFTSAHFMQTRYPHFWCTITWSKLPHRAFEISSYHVDEKFSRNPKDLNEWLSFVLSLVDLHDTWFASFALHKESLQKNFMSWWKQHPRAKDPAKGVETASGVGVELEKGVPGIYWGNYFGPFYVEWFGREKFETIPCIEKRWLDTGGIFFTTADNPFQWNSPAARELQEAVKRHLGADAFFDMETVRALVRQLEPIPASMEPEQFQSPRRLPTFPFEIQQPPRKSVEEELQEAREYFESQGFEFVHLVDGKTLVFHDEKGGVTRVTVGPGGTVEYWPNID